MEIRSGTTNGSLKGSVSFGQGQQIIFPLYLSERERGPIYCAWPAIFNVGGEWSRAFFQRRSDPLLEKSGAVSIIAFDTYRLLLQD